MLNENISGTLLSRQRLLLELLVARAIAGQGWRSYPGKMRAASQERHGKRR